MKNRRLNRDHHARQALFKGLVGSLIEREVLETTSAKARAVRRLFEKLLTKARVGSLHARRQVQSFLQQPELVKKLVDDLAPRYQKVKGGYTILQPVRTRRGDNAPIVRLSLTKRQAAPASVPQPSPKPTQSKSSKSTPAAPTPLSQKSTKLVKQAPITQAGRIGFRQGER